MSERGRRGRMLSTMTSTGKELNDAMLIIQVLFVDSFVSGRMKADGGGYEPAISAGLCFLTVITQYQS